MLAVNAGYPVMMHAVISCTESAITGCTAAPVSFAWLEVRGYGERQQAPNLSLAGVRTALYLRTAQNLHHSCQCTTSQSGDCQVLNRNCLLYRAKQQH